MNEDIFSLNGLFSCGDYLDINIFRVVLKDDVYKGERVETENGYNWNERVKAPGPLYIDEKYIRMKRRAAQKHETVNLRLKALNCLNKKNQAWCCKTCNMLSSNNRAYPASN